MHAQKCADAMTGTMVIVEASLPEKLACEDVELNPGCPWRKDGLAERNVTFQHEREHTAMLIAGFTDDHGAGDVCGAIEILAAGIDQVEVVHLQLRRFAVHVVVVTEGTVGAGG